MIGLSGFKGVDFIFISTAEEIRGNRTGLAVQLPPLTIVCIVYAFGALAGEHRLVAVLKANRDTVDLYHIDNFYSSRRHNQDIAEPNGLAGIVHADLIGRQRDLRAVDIELCVLIEAVALFHAQIGNFEIYAIGVALSGFKLRNELTVIASIPEITGCDAVTTIIIGIPTLMIGVNERISNAGAKTRLISSIKVDDSI